MMHEMKMAWHSSVQLLIKECQKKLIRARFRSSDLWVMGPPRFRCATLMLHEMHECRMD